MAQGRNADVKDFQCADCGQRSSDHPVRVEDVNGQAKLCMYAVAMPSGPRVKNHYRDRREPGDVTVMRPSKWGNPFKLGADGTRAEVIEKYRVWILGSELMKDLEELRGKNLVCCCAPKACHADVLLELANK